MKRNENPRVIAVDSEVFMEIMEYVRIGMGWCEERGDSDEELANEMEAFKKHIRKFNVNARKAFQSISSKEVDEIKGAKAFFLRNMGKTIRYQDRIWTRSGKLVQRGNSPLTFFVHNPSINYKKCIEVSYSQILEVQSYDPTSKPA